VGAISRTTLLYDDDCGFCRWSADRIRKWDRAGALTFASIQGPNGHELLRRVPPELRLASMHVVSADERVWSGGEAVHKLLRVLPGGTLPSAFAGAFPVTTDRIYRLAARNRTTFGRWLGEDVCKVDPSRAQSS
jgi:predicted DCC family thiol-disulfide oxidoreductase YuxK